MDHDLRYDAAEAHALDQREATRYDLPAVTVPAQVLTPAQLRTERMPDLRSPAARELDAAARGLDTRTFDRQVIAELVRIVDVVQALALRVDLLEGEREAQL